MDEQLILKNKLKEIRAEKSLSQSELAEMVGVFDRNRTVQPYG